MFLNLFPKLVNLGKKGIKTKNVSPKLVILKFSEGFPPPLTTAKEAYLGNLSDEWETVEKEAMALVEYMKKQIEELLRTE